MNWKNKIQEVAYFPDATSAFLLGGISLTSSGSLADRETSCLVGSKPRMVCMAPLDEGGGKVGMGGGVDVHIRRKKGNGRLKGTFIHRTADVRRMLSLERWGMTPREEVVMKDGVGMVKCVIVGVSAEGSVISRQGRMMGTKEPHGKRLKEKDGVDIGK